MRIRKTTINDLDAVMKIYARARGFMAETGNPTQWKDSYPSEELIRKDISDGVSYVCVDEDNREVEVCTDSDRGETGKDASGRVCSQGEKIPDECKETGKDISGRVLDENMGGDAARISGEHGREDITRISDKNDGKNISVVLAEEEKNQSENGSGSADLKEVIEAVFMYDMREDPTYAVIEDGAWPNDRPYGVLHRIASSGRKKGVASFCMQWCFAQCGNLRCDTHDNNKVMQHVMKKNGFEYCGRIYVEDGSPRVAFQKVK